MRPERETTSVGASTDVGGITTNVTREASRPPRSTLARPPRPGRLRFWPRLQAGLAFALWLLPGLIAGASIGLYVLGQNVDLATTTDGGDPTLLGLAAPLAYALGGAILGVLGWIALGWLAGRYCTAAISNAEEYHKLASRLASIDAALAVATPTTRSTQKLLAIEEAGRARDSAWAWVSWDGADQQWAYGDLYVAAWRYVHTAEEALVDILPASIVAAEAAMDRQRLRHSAIADAEELEATLTQAVKDLATAEATPEKDDDGVARAHIRAVKSAINAYRDGRSGQLVELGRKVRARHIGVSLIGALLFLLGIVALDPETHLVEAFTVYFLVGALAGIALEALRSSRSRPTSAQDYGLNRERLFLTFTMSGAAACGGVILFVMLLGTTVSELLSVRAPALDPTVVAISPVLILVAAAFGLAPSRLFTAITGLGEQIAIQHDLSSTTPTGASISTGPGTANPDEV
jgi:hypothetical protein